MTNAQSIRIVGKTAIIAALMGGASVALAQEAAPVSPVTAAPATEPSFTPPPAVSTLPTQNDVVNPIAAQGAAVERESRVAAAPVIRPRAAVPPVKAVAPAAVVPAAISQPSTDRPTDIAPPAFDAAEPASAVVDNGTAIAPAEAVAAPDTGNFDENLTLVGSLAAVLAAIGLGATFASRRRRKVVAEKPAEVTPQYVAPRPTREDPVFQQFAARSAPERLIQRAPIAARSDMPVTDPLFSAPVIAGPITDPLFRAKAEVPPITDPMFAHLAEYEGRNTEPKATWAFGTRRNWNEVSESAERMPRELEPAE
jgi:hypothetical protein